jgi:hypothetical protein
VKNAHAQNVAKRSKPSRLRQASLHLRLKDSTGLSARTHPRLLISTAVANQRRRLGTLPVQEQAGTLSLLHHRPFIVLTETKLIYSAVPCARSVCFSQLGKPGAPRGLNLRRNDDDSLEAPLVWLTARDMSQSFSNVALQLSIDAVGLLVDAVHIVNCAPASQQGISRATRLMMDASTACMECLSGADTSNTPHLVATREHSMGQTLIENMTVMTRVIADTTQMVKSMCALDRAISFDD